jgi:putative SOS response-associated peptidase YedK
MRWGLVPHWADLAGKKPPLMINARVESLHAKQFFRDALHHKRCLVPADGFFEWVRAQTAGKKSPPRPFYFHPRSQHLIAFAGLWARSHDDHGHELHSFTIITAQANDLVRPIHDRMPIVLAPAAYAAWLDPAVDGEAARALLGHPAGDDWTREPVSTWVNKTDHDDPACIAPPVAEPDGQGRLFD